MKTISSPYLTLIVSARLRAVLVGVALLVAAMGTHTVAGAPSVALDASALALPNGEVVTNWGGQSAAGTPTYLRSQAPNGQPAVEFNGGDRMGDNVSLPASAAADWIFVAVINPKNIGGYHNLTEDDLGTRPMLWIDPGFNYELNFGGGTGLKAAGTGPGGWDIVIADSRLNQLYVNSPTPNATGGGAVSYPATRAYDFFHRDGGQTFQGLVAEVRIYNNRADFGGDFAALYQEMRGKWLDGLYNASHGAALTFNGAGHWANAPHHPSLNVTAAITLEAWVKITDGNNRMIVTKGNDSFYLGVGADGNNVNRACFYLQGVSPAGWLYGTTDLKDNRWHHVAGTYDGTAMRIYVDGQLDGSVARTGNIATGANVLHLGARPGGSFFAGLMDEVRIWNVARSPAAI